LAGGSFDVAPSLQASGKAAGSATQQDAENGMLVAHSLRADGFDASEDGTGRGTPLAISFHSTQGVAPAVAFQESQSGDQEYDTSGSLRAHGPGHDPVGTRVRIGMGVRRLTPTECEFLQGFPRDWTRIPYRGKPADDCPDGPRYRALGNSMACNVMRWLGRRIQMVDEVTGTRTPGAE